MKPAECSVDAPALGFLQLGRQLTLFPYSPIPFANLESVEVVTNSN